MKYFHFPSPTLRRIREPFTKRRGPGLRWRAPAERHKPWLSPETRGAVGGWGRREWMAREMLVRGTLAAICTRSVRS
jgi:hypothetical protein